MYRRLNSKSKKFIPKFIRQNKLKLEQIKNNPCLIKASQHRYGSSQKNLLKQQRKQLKLIYYEQKGIPILNTEQKKKQHYKKRLYHLSFFQKQDERMKGNQIRENTFRRFRFSLSGIKNKHLGCDDKSEQKDYQSKFNNKLINRILSNSNWNHQQDTDMLY